MTMHNTCSHGGRLVQSQQFFGYRNLCFEAFSTFPIIFPLWSKSGFIVISPKKKKFQSCILWALVVNSEQFGVPRDVDHPGMWGHQRLCGLVPASKTIPQTNCQARLLHRINNAIVILSIPLQYVVFINSFLGSMFRFSFLNLKSLEPKSPIGR